ncbi:MAG: hypothetical protein PHE50_09720 [Dehalococcoidales bacterium]|nr:hypothetical protein [Dehalococcoidales bacterium]
MKKVIIVLTCILLFTGLFLLSGCAGKTRIGDIISDPMKYENTTVHIKGTVGDTLWFALLSRGGYQLGDGTGTIWVVTSQPPPQKGLEISTSGTVSTAFKLGDKTLGTVVTETRRD